ncbi:MAG: hypothetical protein ACRDNF_00110 [Streptosporangiaceae bacterium]
MVAWPLRLAATARAIEAVGRDGEGDRGDRLGQLVGHPAELEPDDAVVAGAGLAGGHAADRRHALGVEEDEQSRGTVPGLSASSLPCHHSCSVLPWTSSRACPRGQLPPGGRPGLRGFLLSVPGPGDPRGVRHSLASVLLARRRRYVLAGQPGCRRLTLGSSRWLGSHLSRT